MNKIKDVHLIFFDHRCGLCLRSVDFILNLDHDRQFLFAPLEGQTAQELLTNRFAHLKNENSLILFENFRANSRVWLRGRAIFRILWLIGGIWKLIGWLCFIPLGVDLVYRCIANHRYKWFKKNQKPVHPEDSSRFLK